MVSQLSGIVLVGALFLGAAAGIGLVIALFRASGRPRGERQRITRRATPV